jgi:hypothetical protein
MLNTRIKPRLKFALRVLLAVVGISTTIFATEHERKNLRKKEAWENNLITKTLWCIGNQTNKMAKQPKPTTSSKPGSLGSIYTGPKSQDPGVLKAQADKAKAAAIAIAYKKKAGK